MVFQDVIQFPSHMKKVRSQALCPDVNVLMQSERLFSNAIGDTDSNRNYIFQTGKTFFAKLYGGKQMKITSMNELRFQLFTSRKAKAPAIKNLPPTDEALEHHIMRAHL